MGTSRGPENGDVKVYVERERQKSDSRSEVKRAIQSFPDAHHILSRLWKRMERVRQ